MISGALVNLNFFGAFTFENPTSMNNKFMMLNFKETNLTQTKISNRLIVLKFCREHDGGRLALLVKEGHQATNGVRNSVIHFNCFWLLYNI